MASGAAITDLQAFETVISKRAPDLAAPRAKALCACQDGTSAHGRAGTLRQQTIGNDVFVVCAVPGFDGSGQQTLVGLCSTFVSLGK